MERPASHVRCLPRWQDLCLTVVEKHRCRAIAARPLLRVPAAPQWFVARPQLGHRLWTVCVRPASRCAARATCVALSAAARSRHAGDSSAPTSGRRKHSASSLARAPAACPASGSAVRCCAPKHAASRAARGPAVWQAPGVSETRVLPAGRGARQAAQGAAGGKAARRCAPRHAASRARPPAAAAPSMRRTTRASTTMRRRRAGASLCESSEVKSGGGFAGPALWEHSPVSEATVCAASWVHGGQASPALPAICKWGPHQVLGPVDGSPSAAQCPTAVPSLQHVHPCDRHSRRNREALLRSRLHKGGMSAEIQRHGHGHSLSQHGVLDLARSTSTRCCPGALCARPAAAAAAAGFASEDCANGATAGPACSPAELAMSRRIGSR